MRTYAQDAPRVDDLDSVQRTRKSPPRERSMARRHMDLDGDGRCRWCGTGSDMASMRGLQ